MFAGICLSSAYSICVFYLCAGSLFHEAQTSCGEDVFLPRCADCCGRMVLTPQSLRQESEVCQPVQLITPPLSHSGQRLFAGEPKRVMGLWRSTQWHSNSKIRVGTFSSSLELCHVIYLMPHDAISFSSWGVHSDSSWTFFPSQCSSTWHSFISLEIIFYFLHFVKQMWFPHWTVFARDVLLSQICCFFTSVWHATTMASASLSL